MKVKIKTIKKIFEINDTVQHILVYAFATTFIYIFIKAFVNGYTATININFYGEALIELIIIFIMLISGFIKLLELGFDESKINKV